MTGYKVFSAMDYE